MESSHLYLQISVGWQSVERKTGCQIGPTDRGVPVCHSFHASLLSPGSLYPEVCLYVRRERERERERQERGELIPYSSPCRGWRLDPATQSYVIIATSVSHPFASLLAGVRATELAMRYLIEPLPNNCSRLTVFCRVDMRSVPVKSCEGKYVHSA